MSELLSCPFCGGPAGSFPVLGVAHRAWFTGCQDCHIYSRVHANDPSKDDRAKAAAHAAWNRRTPAPDSEGERDLEAAGQLTIEDVVE